MVCGSVLWADGPGARYAQRFRFDDRGVLVVGTTAAEWCYRLVARVPDAGGDLDGRPDDGRNCATLMVPLRRIVTLSTTHIGYLAALDLLDRVVGHSGVRWLYGAEVRARAAQEQIVEVGAGGLVDVERIVALQPDVVFVYPDVAASVLAELKRAAVPTLMVLEYLEQTPLGRSEWIGLLGRLTGQDELAGRLFADVEQSYRALVDSVAGLPAKQRPSVLVGSIWAGSWLAPAGSSYVAHLIADAGGRYVWAEDSIDASGLLFLDLEAVFTDAGQAQVWLDSGLWRSRDAIVAADSRLSGLAALQSGRVYNNDARRNAAGGSDYYESGALNAHLLLADLIAILHPQLRPHRLHYYRRVP